MHATPPKISMMRQMVLPRMDLNGTKLSNPRRNWVQIGDEAFHGWYRFVLSFPPHLVNEYLSKQFELEAGQTVLDPFCGTGTTVVEAKKLGYRAFGLEANRMAHFASIVKCDWTGFPGAIRALADSTVERATAEYDSDKRNSRKFSDEEGKLVLWGGSGEHKYPSITETHLNKILLLRELIEDAPEALAQYARLALAKTAVVEASDLHFGPEVGVRRSYKRRHIFEFWREQMLQMASDIESIQGVPTLKAEIRLGDARAVDNQFPARSIDAVFTSPPYPNEKDYTRTTRLESVLLGFLKDRQQLRSMKQDLVRSNTRNVYTADLGDQDDRHAEVFPEVMKLVQRIETKRRDLGKTSGFERYYSRVVSLYFGGMARHFEGLTRSLAPNARLAYVVGDQASFFRIQIDTARLLGEIARYFGYEVVGDPVVFRTRIATATRRQMEEHILLLRWPR